ncbi:DAK2 domain-containing protein [Candidatus Woesearchaeota archaeon]|nr:DAK2 domain-containing protein [Candidatus Woesearchaeota archaeon]
MECQTSVVKINSKKLDGNISKYYHIANRINVFPVPDKDTGTNVYHTINKSLEKIPHNEIFLPAYCSSLLENMEYFSLGNSGKIFSLFFTNSFKSWIKDNKIFVDVNELENALVNGIKNTWNYLDSIG